MFFLLTNLAIKKYTSNFVVQILVGLFIYIILLLVLKDVSSEETLNKYKYYIIILAVLDIMLLLYMTRKKTKEINLNKKSEENSDTESDDYKISHELSPSSDQNLSSMFSSSDEKSDSDLSDSSMKLSIKS
jgi:undecaprenyl pyrophosphate phosphatase UppP